MTMAEKKKKKKAKAAKSVKPGKTRAAAPRKAPTKPAAKRPAKKAAPRRAPSAPSAGFDITKLIDHPLVADLLAVGAMAAVAAIADHSVKTRTGETEAGSSKAVKAAGKAAATAIGKRLMTEVDAVRRASKPAAAKSGSK
jgi:hypothetical protein